MKETRLMAEFRTEEIKALRYARPPIHKGYANQTLYVNLSDSTIAIKPVDEKDEGDICRGKGFRSLASLECCKEQHALE